jgi:uncharacterized protein
VQPNWERIYHDPLHGAIALNRADPIESLLIRLVDTPEFQRLRRIRQLGPASLTFHGAEGSRFTHSLGVMAIARRAFDRIANRYPELQPYRVVVLCAALLHDIGHGPFSHTSEEMFGGHHEHWSRRIIHESPDLNALLSQHSPDLLMQIEQVYTHTHPVPLVWQLVSSQLDCDRLDYLMRDSYFTGASYGRLDLDRILMAMNFDPNSQQLVVAHKGVTAIEHYLLVRYFMYAQIYNHPKNLAATWGLDQAIQRAKVLYQAQQLSADDVMQQWLTQPCNQLSLAAYLAMDDGVLMYHLQRWQSHPDPLLSDLCRRFLQRDLLKSKDVTDLARSQQEEMVRSVQEHLRSNGWIAEPYVGLRVATSRGYTLYQKGIKVQTNSGLVEINQVSPLVQTLIQPYQRVWLIYPRELNDSYTSAIASS